MGSARSSGSPWFGIHHGYGGRSQSILVSPLTEIWIRSCPRSRSAA
ncbi:hypothetical protein ACFFX0_16250 [Citricoccus parietis]|uniref:Uncharacterized protein n=1 Tax=Citricoccus parietis TaxID=592307 RepID=A0ABV5G1Y0_9MICC